MNRQGTPSYEFGPFRLDVSEHLLLRDGQPVVLTPKVFDVLRVLVQNAGHLVEKERLLSEVWANSFVEEGGLNRNVSILRKALGEKASGEQVHPDCSQAWLSLRRAGHRTFRRRSSLIPSRVGEPDCRRPPCQRFQACRRCGWIAVQMVGALAYAVLRLTVPANTTLPSRPPTAVAEHRQVTFTGKEGAPSLSADGRRIAYVS